MIDNYTPNIGDLVKITKSNINWVNPMDIFDGIDCKIKSVKQDTYNGENVHRVKFEENKEYPGLRKWSWMYECNHFVPIRIKNRKEIKIKSNIWKTIYQKSEI